MDDVGVTLDGMSSPMKPLRDMFPESTMHGDEEWPDDDDPPEIVFQPIE